MSEAVQGKRRYRAGTLAALFALWALLGFSVSQAFNFYWLAQYEDELFEALVVKAPGEAESNDAYALRIAQRVHELVTPGFQVFHHKDSELKPKALFRSPAFDLLDARGACGSFSAVLARALLKAGFPVRIGQMTCLRASGELVPGCHMVVEAQVDGRWAVFDAMYDLHFRTPDGQLAGFQAVSADWPYFQTQVAADYPVRWYNYHAVRYTNWDKIPYVMPAAKAALRWLGMGERVDTMSLRVYVLEKFRLNYFAMVFVSFGLIGVLAYLHLWRRWPVAE